MDYIIKKILSKVILKNLNSNFFIQILKFNLEAFQYKTHMHCMWPLTSSKNV